GTACLAAPLSASQGLSACQSDAREAKRFAQADQLKAPPRCRRQLRTEDRLHRPAPSREVVRAFSVARSLEGGLLPTAGKCPEHFAAVSNALLSRLEMHLSIPSSWD